MTTPIAEVPQPLRLTRLQEASAEDRVRADRLRLIFAASHEDLDDPAREKRYSDGLGDR